MPRLDFEKQFARQLKSRELQPSAESWKKLQGKLERGEKRNLSLYKWIAIAASLVGAVWIFGTLFHNPAAVFPEGIVDAPAEESLQDGPRRLESEPPIVSEGSNSSALDEEFLEEYAKPQKGNRTPEAEVKTEIAESRKSVEPESAENPKLYNGSNLQQAMEEHTAVASGEISGKGTITDAEINDLLARAIAEVSKEMPEAGKVTDAQIETLLAEARAEVRKERVQYQTATLDAGELLLEVEAELEDSFREQVLEIIKDGLRKTKTAVANINE